ncbi:MAG: hypothetical protein WCW02_03625 [Candidatus Buchananbacteria bacterium]
MAKEFYEDSFYLLKAKNDRAYAEQKKLLKLNKLYIFIEQKNRWQFAVRCNGFTPPQAVGCTRELIDTKAKQLSPSQQKLWKKLKKK